MTDQQLLMQLSDAIGVSGEEGPVRDVIWSHVRKYADEAFTDTMGNLYVSRRQGRQGPVLMVSAHMDEVGFMIHHIESDGLLRFSPVGGLDPRILPGRAVVVGPKQIPGVIGAPPIHLTTPGERKKALPMDQLYIDIGADDRAEAEKLVKLGDRAVFATKSEPFGDGLLKGKALDNRVGCALLVRAMAMDCPFPVTGVFTVQEEIGLRGAQVAAYRVEPAMALILEGTTCADTPGTEDHEQSTRLGDGPAITFMDASIIPNRVMVEGLIEAAERAGVPWQWKRTTFGGTDGGAVHKEREGVPTAVLSVPCRYIHGPAAVMNLADFEAARRTVASFLAHLDGVWARIMEERGMHP